LKKQAKFVIFGGFYVTLQGVVCHLAAFDGFVGLTTDEKPLIFDHWIKLS